MSSFYKSLLLRLLQNGQKLDLLRGVLIALFLLGEREHAPGEFPNRAAHRPAQRVLLLAQVEVILSAGLEQIKQVVFGQRALGSDFAMGASAKQPPTDT